MRDQVLGTVLLLSVWGPAASGQTPPAFEGRVDVAASRLPASEVPARPTVVLTRADIARLPVASVPELLLYLAGAGLARRGVAGIQSDVQLEGATFEEVAVLVDGVRVNDPQTGHFDLDIPLPLEAVERVEILPGPGSAVHGPDAFGGVIAITTGAPEAARARVGLGGHGRALGSLSAPLGAGAWAAVTRDSSRGYRPDTDYGLTRGAAGWSGQAADWKLHLTAAGDGQRYGAWAFYSTAFPDEWEQTSTALLTAVASRPVGGAELTLRAGARRHDDDFVLDRDVPAFYRNRHRTRSGELQAALNGTLGAIDWGAGAEGERQVLTSSRLGDHDRNRGALFGEAAYREGRLRLGLQFRADHMERLGWEPSPALGAQLDLGGGWSLAAHRGRSFRLPSFTDLYYVSPATVGNPGLHAERAWTDELALRLPAGSMLVEVSTFRRLAHDLIDYVLDDAGVYRATNYAHAVTTGAMASLLLPDQGALSGLRLGAAWLHSRIEVDPSRSRYALAHPRLELTASGSLALPWRMGADLAARFREPQTRGSYLVVDARLRRPLAEGIAAEVEASNLLARSYEEMDGIPMPGRWVTVSLTWTGHPAAEPDSAR